MTGSELLQQEYIQEPIFQVEFCAPKHQQASTPLRGLRGPRVNPSMLRLPNHEELARVASRTERREEPMVCNAKRTGTKNLEVSLLRRPGGL
jgi:hypothetical protein